MLRSGLVAMLLLRTPLLHVAMASPAPERPRPGDPPDKPTSSGITVRPDDPGITTGMVEYPGLIGPVLGYLAAPTRADVYPGVLVLHDAQGLTEHFKDIARRLAKAGFVALAPDLASRAGGTDRLADPAKVASALAEIGPGQYLQDLNASVRYLEARPLVAKTRIGAIGFGLGGNVIWLILTANHDVKAAVSVSGSIPSDRVAPNLDAAVLTIYGENDQRDSEGITEFENAMKTAGLPFTVKLEPKAGRDFFNDTTARYVPAAAKDAWGLALDWFAQHLKA
ncbi:MAG: dienelactone hydrolase family protein [Bacillati bacterium ANGP1]|uniref:Dienelactone hydrolase family protein n=1 Tax=Candidatus Segetimicrobium genomatis TaxID=2569760 RepID=A0A537LYZ5_9BACT|nr:MAG: dienelactone hydrolase family protein [Terrabacteria group bacterium ANGP1]